MSCNQPDRATRSLPELADLSPSNRDGWGIGWFEDGIARVEREPGRADRNEMFSDAMRRATSHNLIAHLRYATHGEPMQ